MLNYQGISSLTLTGGSGGNVFALQGNAPVLTSINGGGNGQGNWLDYSAFTTAVTVNLHNGSATDIDGARPARSAIYRTFTAAVVVVR